MGHPPSVEFSKVGHRPRLVVALLRLDWHGWTGSYQEVTPPLHPVRGVKSFICHHLYPGFAAVTR